MKKIPLFLVLLVVFSTLLIAGCTQPQTVVVITKTTPGITLEPTIASPLNQTIANLENKSSQAIANLTNKTDQAIANLENKTDQAIANLTNKSAQIAANLSSRN
jgi:uncharacterized lipoprotein YajG